MHGLLFTFGVLASGFCVAAPTLSGSAVVVSGDTLDVAGERVRLRGVDVPGLRQLCRRAAGVEWRCGLLAKVELARRIGGRPVACEGDERDGYGQRVATCMVEGADLGAWLVERGWALAAENGPLEAELEARAAGRGLWHDRFEPSADWRLAASLPPYSEDEGPLDACACAARHKSFRRVSPP